MATSSAAAELGARLRALRTARGVSPETLGKLAGVGGSTIRSLERGLYERPQPRVLQALATALDVSITELLPDQDGIRDVMLGGGRPRGRQEVMALARSVGVPPTALIVLGPRHDPFYIGSADDRQNAEWFARLWQEYEFPAGTHLRRIHYRLLSYETTLPDGTAYTNTEKAYSLLNHASRWARILELVPADQFDDRRNPPPQLYTFATTVPTPEVELTFDDQWWLPAIETNLAQGLYYALPEPTVTGYEYTAAEQSYHLELWIEKSTMDDVLVPLCQAYHANLVTSVGMQSITNAVKLLQRVAALDKPVRVFYISDFDPAGAVMPVSIARQLEFWRERYAPGLDIKLQPLALTHAQVQAYDLPRIPLKETDQRRGNFEATYGQGAVELDALEALYPGVLATLVRQGLGAYRDATLPARLRAAATEAQTSLNQEWRFISGIGEVGAAGGRAGSGAHPGALYRTAAGAQHPATGGAGTAAGTPRCRRGRGPRRGRDV